MKDGDIKVVGLSNSKTKGKTNWKVIGAIVGIVVLAVGVVAGIVLVRQQQNISEQAAVTCTEQCPGSDGVLRNCHPPEADGTSADSTCNYKGRIEFCGTKNFCCNGTAWTIDMTACATPAPTVKPTATATSTSSTQPSVTATSTSKATATSTSSSIATSTTKSTATSTIKSLATATSTSAPLPVTGVEWPTMLGVGFGIIMIIASMALAL